MKKFILLFFILFVSFCLFSLDMESIQKKIVGGTWSQVVKEYNQVFYYSFNKDNTGHVYYTQNGKKIGEYDMTYKIEDSFVIITALGYDLIWEVTAITDSILVIKTPGQALGATLRRG